MKKVFALIGFGLILAFCMIGSAYADDPADDTEPFFSVTIEETEETPYQSGSSYFVAPEPESYQSFLENSDPNAPDFERYGLDRYVVDFARSPVDGEETLMGKVCFQYVTSGWDGEKRTPQYPARASVCAEWMAFDYSFIQQEGDTIVVVGDNQYSRGTTLLIAASEDIQRIVDEVEAAAGDGYEWRSLKVSVQMRDWDNGYSIGIDSSDYYDIDGADSSAELISVSEAEGLFYKKHVSYYAGNESTYYQFGWSEKQTDSLVCYYVYYYVPKGYDGCVLSLYDARLAPDGHYEEGKHIYDYMNENMVSFRLK